MSAVTVGENASRSVGRRELAKRAMAFAVTAAVVTSGGARRRLIWVGVDREFVLGTD